MTGRSAGLLVTSLLTTTGGIVLLNAAATTAPQALGALVAGAGLAGAAHTAIGAAGDQRSPPDRRRAGR